MSHDQTITATLELLAGRFPACFSIYEGRRRPLKIGIHNDILAALGDAVSEAELRQALRCYTSNRVYRGRLVAGANRIDLAGNVAGAVTEHEAAGPAAARAVKNLPVSAPPAEPIRPIPSTPIPAPAPTKTTTSAAPKRLSLVDLRAAAAARKAATS